MEKLKLCRRVALKVLEIKKRIHQSRPRHLMRPYHRPIISHHFTNDTSSIVVKVSIRTPFVLVICPSHMCLTLFKDLQSLHSYSALQSFANTTYVQR